MSGFTDDGVVMGDGYAFTYSVTRYGEDEGTVRFYPYIVGGGGMFAPAICAWTYGSDQPQQTPEQVIGAYEDERIAWENGEEVSA